MSKALPNKLLLVCSDLFSWTLAVISVFDFFLVTTKQINKQRQTYTESKTTIGVNYDPGFLYPFLPTHAIMHKRALYKLPHLLLGSMPEEIGIRYLRPNQITRHDVSWHPRARLASIIQSIGSLGRARALLMNICIARSKWHIGRQKDKEIARERGWGWGWGLGGRRNMNVLG